jgi:enamine deaminase RidA (YjgF/YER057c/UK114 family)
MMFSRREVLASWACLSAAATRKPYSSTNAAVAEGAPLVHTAQVGGASAGEAIAEAGRRLKSAGSGLERTVKLNFVLASDGDADEVRAALDRVWGKRALKPAVSFVTGQLARPDAKVLVDAVGVTGKASGGDAHAMILPAGGRSYVSGQSADGSIPDATRKTMDKLHRALRHQGLDWKDVVQLKSFLDPIGDAEQVRGIVNGYFDAPRPQVFVEWTSKNKIEIELIASAPGAREPIEYLTPAGETASPVFARIVRVANPVTIYVSGLYGTPGAGGARQIHEIMETLKDAAGKAGSDLLHLAKATYYVADDVVSRQLNEIRPGYYNPMRPPAASKAPVRAVGRKGCTITLDMIAVPK